MSVSTRMKLLAAAEKILVEQGVNSLSVRKIGDAADLNPTLVTYHFKSIFNLLDELCTLNLNPILAGWQDIGATDGEPLLLEELMRAWIEPMFSPAAFTAGGRALIVLDELVAHGEPALRDRVLESMTAFSFRLQGVLAPMLPHLDRDELRARVRFISGAVLGPPPRSYRSDLGVSGKADADVERMQRFAIAAFTH